MATCGTFTITNPNNQLSVVLTLDSYVWDANSSLGTLTWYVDPSQRQDLFKFSSITWQSGRPIPHGSATNAQDGTSLQLTLGLDSSSAFFVLKKFLTSQPDPNSPNGTQMVAPNPDRNDQSASSILSSGSLMGGVWPSGLNAPGNNWTLSLTDPQSQSSDDSSSQSGDSGSSSSSSTDAGSS
jgi:hypothetical protein